MKYWELKLIVFVASASPVTAEPGFLIVFDFAIN